MDVKRASHCVYQTHYHIVFPVKYRKSLLDKEISEGIKGIACEIGERYEIEFEQKASKVTSRTVGRRILVGWILRSNDW